jgi:hypothetical protein
VPSKISTSPRDVDAGSTDESTGDEKESEGLAITPGPEGVDVEGICRGRSNGTVGAEEMMTGGG